MLTGEMTKRRPGNIDQKHEVYILKPFWFRNKHKKTSTINKYMRRKEHEKK
jgi:hypothetical protein